MELHERVAISTSWDRDLEGAVQARANAAERSEQPTRSEAPRKTGFERAVDTAFGAASYAVTLAAIVFVLWHLPAVLLALWRVVTYGFGLAGPPF